MIDAPLPSLPVRDAQGHKGTFGTVAVVGGCAERSAEHDAPSAVMIGAPVLAARAALRAGCGLARLVVPRPIARTALAMLPSATCSALPTERLGSYTASAAARAVDDAAAASACLVVGPGLGRGAGPTGAVLRAVQQHDAPLVLDADGLNLLAAMPAFTSDFHAAAVVTPHPGEFETMAKALGLPPRPRTPAERRAGAEGLAQRLGCVVVLKGAGTVVTDGQRTRVNTSGIDALATAGTGDVLAGLIGGLVAQFVSIPDPRPFPMPPKPRPPGKPLDLFEAACIAVHAHGLAAERWCTRHGARAGLLATELADEIPSALSALAALAPAAAP